VNRVFINETDQFPVKSRDFKIDIDNSFDREDHFEEMTAWLEQVFSPKSWKKGTDPFVVFD